MQCLAATSQLQRLDIVSKKWESKALNGDALLSQILPLHGKTLQELKIPNFRISSTQLRVVLMQCVNLKVLWLGVTAALQVSALWLRVLKLMHPIAPSSRLASQLMFTRNSSRIW